MVYYIGDTHLGHKNIITHDGRPFSSVEEMNEAIIRNWQETVTDADDVYVLGDFSYRGGNIKKYLDRLPGKLHLIIGNHDGKLLHDKNCKRRFESIDRYLEIEDANRQVILFHYPLAEWNGYFRGAVHVFGHIHNNLNDAGKYMLTQKNAYNAGCMFTGYRPVTLDWLEQNAVGYKYKGMD